MIIVWRGWGIVVLPIVVAAFFVATAINVAAGLKPGVLFGFVFVATSALAALSIWAIAHKIESEPGRVFIEQATGRQVVFKRGAGSLFFIPTRYWSYIVVGVGVLAGVASALPQ
jgi:hypothetical protein